MPLIRSGSDQKAGVKRVQIGRRVLLGVNAWRRVVAALKEFEHGRVLDGRNRGRVQRKVLRRHHVIRTRGNHMLAAGLILIGRRAWHSPAALHLLPAHWDRSHAIRALQKQQRNRRQRQEKSLAHRVNFRQIRRASQQFP